MLNLDILFKSSLTNVSTVLYRILQMLFVLNVSLVKPYLCIMLVHLPYI